MLKNLAAARHDFSIKRHLIVSILRGRPVMYRAHLAGTVTIKETRASVVECHLAQHPDTLVLNKVQEALGERQGASGVHMYSPFQEGFAWPRQT